MFTCTTTGVRLWKSRCSEDPLNTTLTLAIPRQIYKRQKQMKGNILYFSQNAFSALLAVVHNLFTIC